MPQSSLIQSSLPQASLPPCPKCQKPLQRTRRKPLERKLSYLIPVERYICFNHACRWTGLLINWSSHPILGKNSANSSSAKRQSRKG